MKKVIIGILGTSEYMKTNDAFYDVYDIAETDGMYVAPQNRVGIWK